MFGEHVVRGLYPALTDEVLSTLTTAPIPAISKMSFEKGKSGQKVWSGKDFNAPLGAQFRKNGWRKRRFYYPGQKRNYIEVDFCKHGIGLELQFGKYSFVGHDFAKFLYLFQWNDLDRQIDVGVEIVPCSNLQRLMYSGPPAFESVRTMMKAKARNDPPVPIWLIGVDVEDD